jgi:RNA polymerase sigma-70 factor (ECF subfamily)
LQPSPISLSESSLITLLERRDKNSFAILYSRYAGNLYGIALRIVRSPEMAEDILQDSFVKIWMNIDSYDPSKGRLFTWMLNVVRHTAIDHLRSRKRDPLHQPLEDSVGDLDRHYAQYNESVDAIGLETLLALLPFEHQLLIDFFYFRGYTQEQVAQTFQIPVGTVKTRLRNAIRHLRTTVAEPPK